MATTTGGVPYPTSPSALATWAATILALAQFVDDRLNTRSKCYQGVATTNLVTAVAQVCALDTEETDAKGLHNPAVNPSRITAAVAGRYQVVAQAAFAANAAGYRTVEILKNGATVVGANRIMAPPTLPAVVSAQASVFLAVGDYVEMRASQSSGGNLATIVGAGNTFVDATLTGAV